MRFKALSALKHYLSSRPGEAAATEGGGHWTGPPEGGQGLVFDPTNPPPLANLFVSMLQRLGINADRFGSSTGTLRGLEAVG